MTPDAPPLLAVNNLEVVYHHTVQVLKGLSLSVPEGCRASIPSNRRDSHAQLPTRGYLEPRLGDVSEIFGPSFAMDRGGRSPARRRMPGRGY